MMSVCSGRKGELGAMRFLASSSQNLYIRKVFFFLKIYKLGKVTDTQDFFGGYPNNYVDWQLHLSVPGLSVPGLPLSLTAGQQL